MSVPWFKWLDCFSLHLGINIKSIQPALHVWFFPTSKLISFLLPSSFTYFLTPASCHHLKYTMLFQAQSLCTCYSIWCTFPIHLYPAVSFYLPGFSLRYPSGEAQCGLDFGPHRQQSKCHLSEEFSWPCYQINAPRYSGSQHSIYFLHSFSSNLQLFN